MRGVISYFRPVFGDADPPAVETDEELQEKRADRQERAARRLYYCYKLDNAMWYCERCDQLFESIDTYSHHREAVREDPFQDYQQIEEGEPIPDDARVTQNEPCV
jgi:hypothetical protein